LHLNHHIESILSVASCFEENIVGSWNLEDTNIYDTKNPTRMITTHSVCEINGIINSKYYNNQYRGKCKFIYLVLRNDVDALQIDRMCYFYNVENNNDLMRKCHIESENIKTYVKDDYIYYTICIDETCDMNQMDIFGVHDFDSRDIFFTYIKFNDYCGIKENIKIWYVNEYDQMFDNGWSSI
jgi:hypothetical protein